MGQEARQPKDAVIDEVHESAEQVSDAQAQEWAGLEVKPDADLFVFVGRWVCRRGIDLIAVFPAILEEPQRPAALCRPCIDLYGKFAALSSES